MYTLQVAQFRTLAADPGVYDQLTAAIAPSIWELDDVKRGILCQMLGGNDRLPNARRNNTTNSNNTTAAATAGATGSGTDTAAQQQQQQHDDVLHDSDIDDDDSSEGDAPAGGSGSNTRGNRKRGEINVLMCGDPGTSKSQLLGFVHKTAPRGIYTSGKGSRFVFLFIVLRT
jgi:DNA replication licensing factor MCM4